MNETYDKFYARLIGRFDEEVILDIDLAYTIAKFAHRHDVRKQIDPETGKPIRYFEHPRDAAIALLDRGIFEPYCIKLALLHDTLEDTRAVTEARLSRWFGDDVCHGIVLLSKSPELGDDGYIKRLMTEADWRVLVVKAGDRLTNTQTLKAGSKAFQVKQINETVNKYYPLFDLLIKMTPEKYAGGVRQLVSEICKLVDEYRAEYPECF